MKLIGINSPVAMAQVNTYMPRCIMKNGHSNSHLQPHSITTSCLGPWSFPHQHYLSTVSFIPIDGFELSTEISQVKKNYPEELSKFCNQNSIFLILRDFITVVPGPPNLSVAFKNKNKQGPRQLSGCPNKVG